jgi:hypothetical protein
MFFAVRNHLTTSTPRVVGVLLLPILCSMITYANASTSTPSPSSINSAPNILDDFPTGWHISKPSSLGSVFGALCVKSNGRQIVEINCPPQDPSNAVSGYVVVARRFPVGSSGGKDVRFRAAVRMANLPNQTGTARLWLRVDLPNGKYGFFDNMFNRPITSHKRVYYEIVGPVPQNATDIMVGFMGIGGSTAFVDDCSLSQISPSIAADEEKTIDLSLDQLDASSVKPTGPQVIDVQQNAEVQSTLPGAVGTVTFPVAGVSDTQVPISTKVTAQPSDTLIGYRLRQRPDSMNWLCVVKVRPPSQGAKITVETLVLTDDHALRPLPILPMPVQKSKIALGVGPWLESTACVQSADPLILKKASQLASGVKTVDEYVRHTLIFTSSNQGTPGAPFTQLDARSGLLCGGSCTNRANLFAALMRANRIPARTVSAMPSYFGQSLYYEHWIAQYWMPSVGWVWVEPTLGQMRVDTSNVVVLSVSSPDDENRAFDPQQEKYAMPGAPYCSVAELSSTLAEASNEATDGINSSVALSTVSGTAQQVNHLFNIAREGFPKFEQQESEKEATVLKMLASRADAVQIANALHPSKMNRVSLRSSLLSPAYRSPSGPL